MIDAGGCIFFKNLIPPQRGVGLCILYIYNYIILYIYCMFFFWGAGFGIYIYIHILYTVSPSVSGKKIVTWMMRMHWCTFSWQIFPTCRVHLIVVSGGHKTWANYSDHFPAGGSPQNARNVQG